MIHSIKFSIIIPTYNRGELIADAVKSVLDQKYSNWELLVIDDGGTDNTEEIIRSLHDNRIQYHWQENKERGAARNKGTQLTTGEYVTFLDSDDVLLNDYFNIALEMIEKNNFPPVFALSYFLGDKKIIHPDPVNQELIYGNPLSCTGVFMRHDMASENLFNETRALAGLEDWELWLRIASRYPIPATEKPGARMREHDNRSVATASPESLIEKFNVFREFIIGNPDTREFIGKKIHLFNNGCLTYIALHLALGGYKRKALNYLLKGLREQPSFIFRRRFYAIIKHLLR